MKLLSVRIESNSIDVEWKHELVKAEIELSANQGWEKASKLYLPPIFCRDLVSCFLPEHHLRLRSIELTSFPHQHLGQSSKWLIPLRVKFHFAALLVILLQRHSPQESRPQDSTILVCQSFHQQGFLPLLADCIHRLQPSTQEAHLDSFECQPSLSSHPPALCFRLIPVLCSLFWGRDSWVSYKRNRPLDRVNRLMTKMKRNIKTPFKELIRCKLTLKCGFLKILKSSLALGFLAMLQRSSNSFTTFKFPSRTGFNGSGGSSNLSWICEANKCHVS